MQSYRLSFPHSARPSASFARRSGCAIALFACLVSCTPKIGDECVTSVDCSQQGDRLCDTSQPLGYCTVFNCEPDKCPAEASCVGFGQELDPSCGPVVDPRWPRFERTFCLLACDDDSDCREGFECAAPAGRRAVTIDLVSENRERKACFAKSATATVPIVPTDACYPVTATSSTASVGSSSSASTTSNSTTTSVSTSSSTTTAASSSVSASASGSSSSGGGGGGGM